MASLQATPQMTRDGFPTEVHADGRRPRGRPHTGDTIVWQKVRDRPSTRARDWVTTSGTRLGLASRPRSDRRARRSWSSCPVTLRLQPSSRAALPVPVRAASLRGQEPSDLLKSTRRRGRRHDEPPRSTTGLVHDDRRNAVRSRHLSRLAHKGPSTFGRLRILILSKTADGPLGLSVGLAVGSGSLGTVTVSRCWRLRSP